MKTSNTTSEKYDPDDPLDLSDPFILWSKVQWYEEQAKLSYHAFHEIKHGRAANGGSIGPDHPLYQIQRALRIARKVSRQVNGKLFGPISSGLTGNKTVGKISFKKQEHPTVSIVIPVYNLPDLTLQCLSTISRSREQTSFEVIIVDDASTDLAIRKLKDIPGLRYVSQPRTRGFTAACNLGARCANGKYIYFLNNDTEVSDSWLSACLDLFSNKEKHIGAIGSKLIYPDGRIQQAGGVVLKSGQPVDYGRDEAHPKKMYNFVREVDYASAAGLMISRDAFNKIDGFDESYSPGLYDDVDLCFRLRAAGYRVYYQPQSVVTHAEGASAGVFRRVHGISIANLRKKNAQLFNNKHEQALKDQYSQYDYEHSPEICSKRKRGLRILVFDSIIPMEDKDHGSVRDMSILRTLALDHTVSFVPYEFIDHPEYRNKVEQLGVEVILREPGYNMTERLRRDGKHVDLLIFQRPYGTPYYFGIATELCPNAKVIYDTHEITHVSNKRQLAYTKDETERAQITKNMQKYKFLELAFGKRADAVWAITSTDQTYWQKVIPNKQVDIVSQAHEVESPVPEYKTRSGIFYIGGFKHPPNVAAMDFYLRKVHPLVQKEAPGTVITIAGADVPPDLKNLASTTIKFTGPISEDDRRKLINKSLLMVCSHVYGSGLKGKIIMSMCQGLPVVGTSIGMEGVPFTNGLEAEQADEPQEFSDKVVRLLRDEKHWTNMSKAGQAMIGQKFSHASMRTDMNNSFDKLFDSSLRPEVFLQSHTEPSLL